MNPVAEFVVGILIFCLYLFVLTAPGREAKKRRCKHAEAIRNLCYLSLLLPILWLAALIWCYVDDRLPAAPYRKPLTASEAEEATRRAKAQELDLMRRQSA